MKGNQLMRKPKLLRALLILLFVAAPIQWTRAQIVLSTPKTTLGAVIKNIKSQSNGTVYTKNYLKHNELLQGGTIDFKMTDRPNMQRGTQESDLPYSFSKDEKVK